MQSDRTTATLVGVLYIVGTLSGVLSAVFLPSLAAGTNILAQIATHRPQTIIGALLILTMGFSLSALSAVFYPLGRRYSEVLSMGYVVFRGALEGVTYLLSTFIYLVLVEMSAEPGAATAAIATLLQTAQRVLWNQVIALPFLVGAAMFYWLLYRARLVPRWLTIWGLIGVVLYLGAPIAQMAGLVLDFLMVPLALQEIVLAIWLIAKGFSMDSAEDKRPLPTA